MNLPRLAVNFVVLAAIFAGLAHIETTRGLQSNISLYLSGVIFCAIIALCTELVRIKGQQYGGWLVVLFLLMSLYVYQAGASGQTLSEVVLNTASRISLNGPTITRNAERLKDAYIVLGTASFTLYGLFFVAVKKINMRNALRLVSIGEAFALVFLFVIPALILSDAPWWRIGLMFGLNLSSLALFARELSPSLADFSDAPAAFTFWSEWTAQRRGYSVLIFVALCILALWPVFGEIVLVITLSYILYGATRSATFLFISTEITIDTLNYDNILRRLLLINVKPAIEQQIKESNGNRFRMWYAQSPAAHHVLFRFGNQKRSPVRNVYFQFRNRKDT